MKSNKIYIIILLVLGSLSAWLYFTKTGSTVSTKLKHIAVTDTSSITKIYMQEGSKQLIVQQLPDKTWKLNNMYAARRGAINAFKYAVSKLTLQNPLSEKHQSKIIEDMQKQGIRCELYQNSAFLKGYLILPNLNNKSAVYINLLKSDKKPGTTVVSAEIPGFDGNLAEFFTSDINIWREYIIFNTAPEHIQSVEMQTPFTPTESYKLYRISGNNFEMQMLSSKQVIKGIDTSVVAQYLSYFQYLRFEKFETSLTMTQIDSLKKSTPLNILTLTTLKAEQITVKFYTKFPERVDTSNVLNIHNKAQQFDTDRLYAVINNDKDIVIAKYFVVGKIMPPVQYFLKK